MVLPLLKSDLFDIMQAVTDGRLSEVPVEFENKSACCVVMASSGYPTKYETGFEITIPDNIGAQVYVAGAKLESGRLLTSGGRVLGVTATGDTLKDAIDAAYCAAENIHFENAYYRKDIGKRALEA